MMFYKEIDCTDIKLLMDNQGIKQIEEKDVEYST